MFRRLAVLLSLALLLGACSGDTADPVNSTVALAEQIQEEPDLSMEEAVVLARQALENARWDAACRDLAGAYLTLVTETIIDSEGLTPTQLREATPSEDLVTAEQNLTDEFNRLRCSQVHYDIDVLQQIGSLQPTNATQVAIIARAMGGTTDRLGTEFVGLVHLIIELPETGFIINPLDLQGPEPLSCASVHEALIDTYQAAIRAASFATDDPRVPLNMGVAMEGDATFFNAIAALNQNGRELGCDPSEINLYILEHHAELQPAGFWGLAFKWSVLFGAAGNA